MPDGFSFCMRFGDTGEMFSHSGRDGDAADFQEALDTAREAAAGKPETQIREVLAAELQVRNIGLMPRLIDVLAVGIARDAEITVGGWKDVPESALERTGRAGRLIGKMIGLAAPREIRR
jgi:hypothetical protein